MKKGVLIFWAAIVVIIVVGASLALFAKAAPGRYDQLAQCIKAQGVIFYGAFWCPHCQATKAEFGSSVQYLPYVECSTPDGQGQTQVCQNAGITEYPTWVRPDGARMSGEHTLAEWAAFSGCTLSGQKTAFSVVATSTAGSASPVQ